MTYNNDIIMAYKFCITLQIVCTQPFNKRLRYGLTFFTVHASAALKDSSFIKKGKLIMPYVQLTHIRTLYFCAMQH